ncbi:DNA starvation/stationary phase protection protein [Kaistella flava (ex Peng et al. 2021)]|uniref:DNA starvation/stationary phase protection protein n=1 Tax=Kaistella flava (ex Peng et al. 2021) TaxID=2038776 RepID=A0A7M2Y8S6_9FLAO|nr:DNA starvation/stationary phase protection protein [Kaistella flava (ex Peng et al. 2021)]QOW10500.1 DNA starvation/stationary phase protection protein [Kaistella flava (ex Peng et al. 2021)]
MKPDLGITQKNLTAVNQILNAVLADGNMLYIKLRKFHWNLSGDNFMELHLLFEDQYNAVAEAADEVAERIATLGGTAIGTTTEFAKESQLKETPGKVPDTQGILKELVGDHESIVKSLRENLDKCEDDYKDAGTADFLNGLMQEHEKMAWKLRKYFKD